MTRKRNDFFRRFRMTFDLRFCELPEPLLPDGFKWVPFGEELISRHAAVKHESFRAEMDTSLFPDLKSGLGCEQMMQAIYQHRKFSELATWLIATENGHGFICDDCATIQGLALSPFHGEIQNVGVAPEYRGLGLGRALVLKALQGFQKSELKQVQLEVTAHNMPAVELYRSIGFRLTQTILATLPTAEEVTSA